MAELSLALLGAPAVTRNGVLVSFDTRKATAVLALLAMHDHELSRERLAGLLWPEADGARARASLRRTLSVTAAAAGPGLRVTRAAVALDPGRVQVDVTDFEAAAAGPDAGSLDRAARLYRDDFLAGFALRDCPEFDDWQAATADRLRQRPHGQLRVQGPDQRPVLAQRGGPLPGPRQQPDQLLVGRLVQRVERLPALRVRHRAVQVTRRGAGRDQPFQHRGEPLAEPVRGRGLPVVELGAVP